LLSPALTIVDVKDLCKRAKVVKFIDCEFQNVGTLKDCILACGDLACLEIDSPRLENWQTLENDVGNVSTSENQKIGTLVLKLQEQKESIRRILEMFQDKLNDVTNIELLTSKFYCDDDEEIKPILYFLKRNQEKIRGLQIYAGYDELLEGLTHLNLEKLITFTEQNDPNVCEFISGQPTITYLDISCIYKQMMECALRYLPFLTVLRLNYYYADELNVISENTQFLSSLTYLELMFTQNDDISSRNNYVCDPCDITFIAMLPKLLSFSCSFDGLTSFVKLGPIENPMLQMEELHLKCNFQCGVDIDQGNIWSLCHVMPNLKKLTLEEKNLKVCPFFCKTRGSKMQFLFPAQ
jgi:hypothetical protein